MVVLLVTDWRRNKSPGSKILEVFEHAGAHSQWSASIPRCGTVRAGRNPIMKNVEETVQKSLR